MKYTARQIAESDELFEKQIHKVRKLYLSRNPDKMMMLEERKADQRPAFIMVE